MSFVSGQRLLAFTKTTVPCSKIFLRYLNGTEGSELLAALEQCGRILFHVSDYGLIIEHDPQVDAQQIYAVLQRNFQEVSMKSAVKILLLHHQCTTSKSVSFDLPQAAVIYFYRSQIIRENKIVDLLIDSTGTVSWFGQHDCVANATRHISNLMQEYFPKDSAHSPPEGYGDATVPQSPIDFNSMMSDNFFSNVTGLNAYGLSAYSSMRNSQFCNASQEEMLKSLSGAFPALSLLHQNPAAGDAPPNINQMMSPLPNELGGQAEHGTQPQAASRSSQFSRPDKRRDRERIYFMVPSTDAPRLIGTRGVNKKRIEEQTGCSITLHTESKKDGEFPVEINGSSLAVCERAKLHIEKFLTSNGNNNEEKKERSRPKVHLEFSPKKAQPTNSSTPKKEVIPDENSNW